DHVRNIVQHGHGYALADMRPCNPRSHEAGAQDTDAADLQRPHVGIGYAGVLLKPLCREENGYQISRNRTADKRDKTLGFDSQSILKWQIASLLNRLESFDRCR